MRVRAIALMRRTSLSSLASLSIVTLMRCVQLNGETVPGTFTRSLSCAGNCVAGAKKADGGRDSDEDGAAWCLSKWDFGENAPAVKIFPLTIYFTSTSQ